MAAQAIVNTHESSLPRSKIMSVSLIEVERQAQELSADDRARLAALLLDSLQESSRQEVQAAWDEEITARVAALKNGSATLFPAADVFAEARKACR
jgi:putative addiction module component (TIGR02574 family)